jgi:hypothetical protein
MDCTPHQLRCEPKYENVRNRKDDVRPCSHSIPRLRRVVTLGSNNNGMALRELRKRGEREESGQRMAERVSTWGHT